MRAVLSVATAKPGGNGGKAERQRQSRRAAGAPDRNGDDDAGEPRSAAHSAGSRSAREIKHDAGAEGDRAATAPAGPAPLRQPPIRRELASAAERTFDLVRQHEAGAAARGIKLRSPGFGAGA